MLCKDTMAVVKRECPAQMADKKITRQVMTGLSA